MAQMMAAVFALMRRPSIQLCLIALPLLYLLVDIVRIPVIFNHCDADVSNITLRNLVEKQYLPLGSHVGHKYYISLDDIRDKSFLGYLKKGPIALGVGIDHIDPAHPVWGAPIQFVLKKLNILSPSSAAELKKLIVGREPSSGHVVALSLGDPNAGFEGLPVSYLYVVGIKAIRTEDAAAKKEQLEIFQSALKELMASSGENNIESLVIPTIGVDPKDVKTLQFEDFFPAVLAVAEPGIGPRNIQFSIFQNWIDAFRRGALDSARQAWKRMCDLASEQSILVRQSLRLTLLALFGCLIVSWMHVAMTVKNFLIITVAFVALAFGAIEGLAPFLEGWGASYELGVTVVVLVFLAAAFPYLPRWNPQDIFDER